MHVLLYVPYSFLLLLSLLCLGRPVKLAPALEMATQVATAWCLKTPLWKLLHHTLLNNIINLQR
jgi:cytochrome c oxidase assembly factor CtaG